MAVQLDTKSKGKELERMEAEGWSFKFKIIKFVLIGLIAVVAILAIALSISKNNDIETQLKANADLRVVYDNMQKQADSNQQLIESGNAEDPNVDNNITKVDKNMYSAQEAGNRVCELMNKNYNKKLVLAEERNELRNFIGLDWVIFGEELDPKESPMTWELLTWYDHTERYYDTVFGCYAPDAAGNPKYLLCLQFATYNGDKNSFSLTNMYYTSFGYMYEQTGKIENNTVSEDFIDIDDMADQLLENNNNSNNDNNDNNSSIIDDIDSIFGIPNTESAPAETTVASVEPIVTTTETTVTTEVSENNETTSSVALTSVVEQSDNNSETNSDEIPDEDYDEYMERLMADAEEMEEEEILIEEEIFLDDSDESEEILIDSYEI